MCESGNQDVLVIPNTEVSPMEILRDQKKSWENAQYFHLPVTDATKILDSANLAVAFADDESYLGWLQFVLKDLCLCWFLWMMSEDGLNLLPMAELAIVCLCCNENGLDSGSAVKGRDFPEQTYLEILFGYVVGSV